MKLLLTTILAAALLFGCDKARNDAENVAKEPATETSEPTAENAPTTGAFSVKDLKVSGSQTVYQLDGVPNPDDVTRKLRAALVEQENFAADGPRELSGIVTYDVRELPDGGHDVMLIGGLGSPNAKFDAGINYKSTQERWKDKSLGEMVDAAVEDFASRISAQARVLGADVEGLVAVLESSEEPSGAQLLAIQELREREAKEQLGAIRPYLGQGHSGELRVAASAALVSLDDTESYGDILQVAQDLSRDRDPQFVPMLHILSDIGGTEVETYLQAVAEGHSAPAVRKVAEDALKNLRAQGKSK